jgi:hypothetical protein
MNGLVEDDQILFFPAPFYFSRFEDICFERTAVWGERPDEDREKMWK